MSNIINRINNEFDFNYQKFVKNNNLTETTSIKPIDNSFSKFNNDTNSKPEKVEEMDFDAEKPKEENVEVLELDE